MRLRSILTVFLAAALLSACDFWPRQFESLADSISEQVAGEATAWRAGGDVMVIMIERSPLYREEQAALEAMATDMAGQAMAASDVPLESVAITFYESEVTEDNERMREFIFLVKEGRPVLLPNLDLGATGPLTPEEIGSAVDRFAETYREQGKTLDQATRQCVVAQATDAAAAAGDPETLDPADVATLSPGPWGRLDAFSRRLVLVQAITTEALFDCFGVGGAGAPSG